MTLYLGQPDNILSLQDLTLYDEIFSAVEAIGAYLNMSIAAAMAGLSEPESESPFQ